MSTNPDGLGSPPGGKSYAISGALGGDVNLASSSELGGLARRLRVGVSGDVEVVCADGTSLIIYNVQVGEGVDVQVAKLIAAGTTAQKITAFK